MPRRPRPTNRKPPTHAQHQQRRDAAKPKVKATLAQKYREEEEEGEESSDEEEFEQGASGSGSSEENDDAGEDEDDADAPRVAQWVDDDEFDVQEDEESDSESEDNEEDISPTDLNRLQSHLSSLPLGTLRKAQKALAHSKEDEDETTSSSDEESAPEEEPSRLDAKETKEKREIAKRANKHAPMEMSSKRPVPRKSANIEDIRPIPRDPRFLHSTGTFDPTRFRSQYGFLSEMHQTELGTLKENLKRARKLLVTSPRDLRSEREAEVQRLERAVKRAESTVNKDKKEKVEENALKKLAKEEKEKRKAGKGAWYMKNADKKELLTRAKYEALAEAGGRSAVRKAIEKKQKKVNQKEKKRRPFVPGEGRGAANGKRSNFQANHSQGGRPSKRQRTS